MADLKVEEGGDMPYVRYSSSTSDVVGRSL